MKKGFDRLRGVAVAGAMGLGMLGAGSGRAATVSIPLSVTRALLATNGGNALSAKFTSIGGSDGNDTFDISEFSVLTTTATIPAAVFGDGFDGVLAMDVGLTTFVNGDGDVDLTGDTITSDLRTNIIAGVDAQIKYTFFAQRNNVSLGVIRALYSLTNTTGAPIVTDVDIGGNYGSDTGTLLQATSDGDTVNEDSDLWLYTNDQLFGTDPQVGSNPGLTISRYGTGAAVVPTTVNALGAGNDTFLHRYNVTIPAGETVRILVFIEGSATNANAVAGAADFETLATLTTAGLLSGLTTGQIGEIVNYDGYVGSPGAGGPGGSNGSNSGALGLPGLLTALGSLVFFRRRSDKSAS